VRVEVANLAADRSTPHVVDAGPRDIGGRGLSSVEQLAAVWGTERDSAGYTRVWFELDPT
jgi:hypothetical protein